MSSSKRPLTMEDANALVEAAASEIGTNGWGHLHFPTLENGSSNLEFISALTSAMQGPRALTGVLAWIQVRYELSNNQEALSLLLEKSKPSPRDLERLYDDAIKLLHEKTRNELLATPKLQELFQQSNIKIDVPIAGASSLGSSQALYGASANAAKIADQSLHQTLVRLASANSSLDPMIRELLGDYAQGMKVASSAPSSSKGASSAMDDRDLLHELSQLTSKPNTLPEYLRNMLVKIEQKVQLSLKQAPQ